MIIFIILTTLFLKSLSAFFNAVMDVVIHRNKETIFIREDSTGHYKKIFGFRWNEWFNFDGLSFLNKYEERDQSKPIKKIKILFWKIEVTVFSDCWHFAKMLMKGTEIINHCFLIASASIIALFNLSIFESLNLSSFASALILASVMFILYALFEIIPFNKFYKKYLIKKKYRVNVK